MPEPIMMPPMMLTPPNKLISLRNPELLSSTVWDCVFF